MPRYPEGTWEAIRAELWYTPGRREILLQALADAGEPERVLTWPNFKLTVAGCIHGMYGANKVSEPERYTQQALEDNSGEWQKFHAALTQEMTRRRDAAAQEKKRLDALKQEPAGGILVDGSAASIDLAHQLLGLGPGNARQAVSAMEFGGDVAPTFLGGRRTYHKTYDDQDGQGTKDAKRTGKKKITFFYDQCDRDCKPGFYLVGWGLHIGDTRYQLVEMVPPTGGPLDRRRQWGKGISLQCGTEKRK